jgi:hypothetical protein
MLQFGRMALVQFALVKHWTHAFVTVSQTGAPAMQFMLVKHWTQRIVDVLQCDANPPVHCMSVVHVLTQRYVVMSQANPVWQLPSALH